MKIKVAINLLKWAYHSRYKDPVFTVQKERTFPEQSL